MLLGIVEYMFEKQVFEVFLKLPFSTFLEGRQNKGLFLIVIFN